MRKSSSNNWLKVTAVFLVVVMLSAPLMAQQAQTTADACAAAERDAALDTNTTLWFIAGCCGGITGLLVSYIYAPSPPASRLLGKSSEYVAAYRDCYKAKAKKIQSSKALTGCLVSAAAYLVYVVLVVAASSGE